MYIEILLVLICILFVFNFALSRRIKKNSATISLYIDILELIQEYKTNHSKRGVELLETKMSFFSEIVQNYSLLPYKRMKPAVRFISFGIDNETIIEKYKLVSNLFEKVSNEEMLFYLKTDELEDKIIKTYFPFRYYAYKACGKVDRTVLLLRIYFLIFRHKQSSNQNSKNANSMTYKMTKDNVSLDLR